MRNAPFEAEVMSEVCNDLLVAYPPVGGPRATRLAALPHHVRLVVALDSERAVAEHGPDAARDAGPHLGVQVPWSSTWGCIVWAFPR